MSRFADIITPLEKDVLLLDRMQAREELSRLSEYEIDLLSLSGDLDLDEVLGKSVTVAVELEEETRRCFSGYVTRIGLSGKRGRYHAYRASVRPWLWLLTRTTNCRIFQEKTVPDILKEVFARHDVSDVAFELTDSYTPVAVLRPLPGDGLQLREPAHGGRGHLLLLPAQRRPPHARDRRLVRSHAPSPDPELPFIDVERLVRDERTHVSHWAVHRELQPGKYALADYDFEKPRVNLHVKSGFKREHALAEYRSMTTRETTGNAETESHPPARV